MTGETALPLELLRYEMLLPAFALVLARVAGLVLAVPMFTSQEIPTIVKAWLAVTLALMVFPVVAPLVPHDLTLGRAAAGMVIQEAGRMGQPGSWRRQRVPSPGVAFFGKTAIRLRSWSRTPRMPSALPGVGILWGHWARHPCGPRDDNAPVPCS